MAHKNGKIPHQWDRKQHFMLSFEEFCDIHMLPKGTIASCRKRPLDVHMQRPQQRIVAIFLQKLPCSYHIMLLCSAFPLVLDGYIGFLLDKLGIGNWKRT
jgi:hypothetical protein